MGTLVVRPSFQYSMLQVTGRVASHQVPSVSSSGYDVSARLSSTAWVYTALKQERVHDHEFISCPEGHAAGQENAQSVAVSSARHGLTSAWQGRAQPRVKDCAMHRSRDCWSHPWQ